MPATDAAGSKTWIVAAIAAVVVLAAIGGYVMTRPDAAPQDTQAAAPAPQAPAPAQITPTPPTTPVPQPETKQPEALQKKPDAAPARKTPAVTPPVAPPVDPPPAAPRPGNILVALSAAYPFEVRDGSRVLSAAATAHEIAAQSNGRTLRLVAPDVLLDHAVKVDGSADNRFE